ncbi:hypothetical protein G5B40_01225 [Pikeienuella piscinae]|uniref:Uncharacterized protein n=1 Tax=Pikeienuella piscinae TaxID=2748098 RepID=A0A7L5BWC9_9RHOB|nr:hypothetical protein [Pikeienuella piscinae]QIE54184.1 hypothetical protein G5B40_01225 [Pikeienuella piscinae]
MLSDGGGPGAAFLDLRTWWSFRENFAEDSAVAVPFLELFAGDEPDWDRAGDQSACGPPQLRVVASEFVPLPPDTNVVIFDLGALSNADDLSVQAQCALLAHYGAALPEAEVRRRFLHRPVGLAMTHVAERTGRICPSGYIADLRRSEAKLLAGGLILSDGAADIVAALSRRGVKVRIVARESALAATLAELRASFPTAEVVHGDIASGLDGLTDDICRTIAATTSPAVISAVIAAGGAALGVADRSDLRKELLAAGARQVLPVISNLTIAP